MISRFSPIQSHDPKDLSASDYDLLYLYLSKNPNELNIEFAIGGKALSVSGSEIDGICFIGFGDGVYVWGDCVIRNCCVDIIGDQQAIGFEPFVVLGNGINIWVGDNSNKNNLIENNIISRCYDCGATIQGHPKKDGICAMNNIIQGNVIYNCCQGWESFMTKKYEEWDIDYINCFFRNNIVFNIGQTSGFGYPLDRSKKCHVLGNERTGSKGMVIENNEFVGGNYYCSNSFKGEYKSNIWRNNICYIKPGDYLLSQFGENELIISGKRKTDKKTIKKYRDLTGDTSTTFHVVSELTLRKKIGTLLNKYTGE